MNDGFAVHDLKYLTRMIVKIRRSLSVDYAQKFVKVCQKGMRLYSKMIMRSIK